MRHEEIYDKDEIAGELKEFEDDAEEIAHKMGLNPRETQYWIVDYEEMNQAAAYNGFPARYPHWRWAIKYLQQKNRGGKIFEMVLNEDPAEAFLQASNTMEDQKAVITHVEGHSDFFANNKAFRNEGELNAVQMLENHREKYLDFYKDPDIDKFDIEFLTDTMVALEDNIDPVRTLKEASEEEEDVEWDVDVEDALENMGISDDVLGRYEDEIEEMMEEQEEQEIDTAPERDLMKFLKDHGEVYDEEKGEAVEMEEWHKEVIEMVRKEAYYFKPQKLTKTMNEGWAAYWESMMMSSEAMADVDEMWNYSFHQALVLNSPGYNPYKVGKDLWEYLENEANRREVAEKLLQVEGVNEDNFHRVLETDVLEGLEPDDFVDSVTSYTPEELLEIDSEKLDHERIEEMLENGEDLSESPWKALTYEGLADRHFSLLRRQNRGFLEDISDADLEEIANYTAGEDRYSSIQEALADVDKTTGWDKMLEVRETHNDITFIDEYVTEEWAKRNEYSATETLEAIENDWIGSLGVVSSHDVEDIKKKLLVMFNNFGKPVVEAHDDNYDNRGELLLVNDYNGYEMDHEQAMALNEMVFKAYGRPVNLVTTRKIKDEEYIEQLQDAKYEVLAGQHYPDYEPEIAWPVAEEEAVRLHFDGEEHEIHEVTEEEMREEGWEPYLTSDHPYDTVPEEWLEVGYEDKYL
jgi:stage V sporulation protein R